MVSDPILERRAGTLLAGTPLFREPGKGMFAPGMWERLFVQVLEVLDDLGEEARREPEDRLARPHIGRVPAAVAAEPVVEPVLDVRDDRRIHAGRLQDGGRAGDSFAPAGVHVGEDDPHQSLDLVLHDHDIGFAPGGIQREDVELDDLARLKGRHPGKHLLSDRFFCGDPESDQPLPRLQRLRERLEPEGTGGRRARDRLGGHDDMVAAPPPHQRLAEPVSPCGFGLCDLIAPLHDPHADGRPGEPEDLLHRRSHLLNVFDCCHSYHVILL